MEPSDMTTGVQQINLYVPELRPRRDAFGATRLGQLVLLVVVLAVLLFGWQQWRQGQLAGELATVEALIRDQTQRTEALERELANRVADAALLREATSREEQATRTLQLLEFMQQVALGNMVGYSGHLKDLARASFQGIWLTSVTLEGDADNVAIEGFVNSPAMLPDYVSRLGAGTSALASRSFHRLTTSLAEDDSGNHAFVLEATR